MNYIKLVLILAAILIVFGASLYVINQKTQDVLVVQPPSNQNGVNNTGVPPPVLPVVPPIVPSQNPTNPGGTNVAGTPPLMMTGIVSKIEGQKVTIMSGAEGKTVTVDAKTVITKQVKDGASFKAVPATINDIKVEQRLIIVSKQNPGGGSTTERIDIIGM